MSHISKEMRDLADRFKKMELKIKNLEARANQSTAAVIQTGSSGVPADPPSSDALDSSTQLSAGRILGGIISDGGSETIDVSEGNGFLRISDDPLADILAITWSAETTLAIPTDTSRHIGIEYNSGSPQVLIATVDSAFNEHDNFHLGDVINEGGVLHIQNIPHYIANGISHLIERLVQTEDPVRGSGLILAESADVNRYVTVTAGTIWNRLTENTIGAIDTDPGGAGDTFDIYYKDGGAGFTKVASESAWDFDSYDDDSGVLAAVPNNKYAVLWFYMEFDGDLVAQYGRATYNTLAGAENEPVPSTAPDRITEHAILIGRIIFQESVTPANQVDTVFSTFLTGTGVTDHDGLGNIQTDDHHTKYTDGEADARAATLIAAEDHHARYTDGEADTRAALQDHDHATPIAAHAGAGDPHGDRAYSDGLGHHTKYNSTNLESDLGLTVAELLDVTTYGSANFAWVPMDFQHESQYGKATPRVQSGDIPGTISNVSGSDPVFFYKLTALPLTKGTLNLYIAGFELTLADADGSDYVFNVYVQTFSRSTTASVAANISGSPFATDDGAASFNHAGYHTKTFTGINIGSFQDLMMYLNCSTVTGDELNVVGIKGKFYYA